VLLYELLTGTRPFEAKDALEVIHGHLAKNPPPPHAWDARVPAVLSEIVGKLMAKNAADRYQSPFGLRPTWKPASAVARTGTIAAFATGPARLPGPPPAPRRLYGREPKRPCCGGPSTRAAGDVHTVLIEGSSGVGKSALAHQARRATAGRGGIFLEGKFNQFQRNVPYFAFSQAFKEFTNLVLTRGAAEVAAWRGRIWRPWGPTGGVLTDLMPHLELLTGPQPRVPALEPSETQNRFHYVLLNFIKGICRAGHPLVLFFDDLQWADAASLNLLKSSSPTRTWPRFCASGRTATTRWPPIPPLRRSWKTCGKKGAPPRRSCWRRCPPRKPPRWSTKCWPAPCRTAAR
jgi:hypothetical protein